MRVRSIQQHGGEHARIALMKNVRPAKITTVTVVSGGLPVGFETRPMSTEVRGTRIWDCGSN
jgi:hypothetical protein